MTLPRASHHPSPSAGSPTQVGGSRAHPPKLTEQAFCVCPSPSGSLTPSGTSRRGSKGAGSRPLTAPWGLGQVSLPLAPLGQPLHCPLQGNQGWGGKALKGARMCTWAGTPGRGLGLGPGHLSVQLHRGDPGLESALGLSPQPDWEGLCEQTRRI